MTTDEVMAMAQVEAARLQEAREAFEKWAAHKWRHAAPNTGIERGKDGCYVNDYVEYAWIGWQALAATSAPAPATTMNLILDLVRALERARDKNNGREPSLSVFNRAVDALIARVLWETTPAPSQATPAPAERGEREAFEANLGHKVARSGEGYYSPDIQQLWVTWQRAWRAALSPALERWRRALWDIEKNAARYFAETNGLGYRLIEQAARHAQGDAAIAAAKDSPDGHA